MVPEGWWLARLVLVSSAVPCFRWGHLLSRRGIRIVSSLPRFHSTVPWPSFRAAAVNLLEMLDDWDMATWRRRGIAECRGMRAEQSTRTGGGACCLVRTPTKEPRADTDVKVGPSFLFWHLHSRHLIMLTFFCRPHQPHERPHHSRWCLVHHQLAAPPFLIILKSISG
jgi:hypothetical protein